MLLLTYERGAQYRVRVGTLWGQDVWAYSPSAPQDLDSARLTRRYDYVRYYPLPDADQLPHYEAIARRMTTASLLRHRATRLALWRIVSGHKTLAQAEAAARSDKSETPELSPSFSRRAHAKLAAHEDAVAPVLLRLARPSALRGALRILLARKARRAACEAATTARTCRVWPAPKWEPVTLPLTHPHGALERLRNGWANGRGFTASRALSHAKDSDEGRYSSRCTYRKIGHGVAVESHGWAMTLMGRTTLRWVIDGDFGRQAGEWRGKVGEPLPSSAKLYRANDDAQYLGWVHPLPTVVGWRLLMEAQRTAARLRRAKRPNMKAVLDVQDTHTRAELIERAGGWAKAAKVGCWLAIDRSPAGTLYLGGFSGVSVLVVRCPSTGRQYGLLVPESSKTVAGALRAVNGVASGRIVAQS